MHGVFIKIPCALIFGSNYIIRKIIRNDHLKTNLCYITHANSFTLPFETQVILLVSGPPMAPTWLRRLGHDQNLPRRIARGKTQ
jgi:hypothetical protein